MYFKKFLHATILLVLLLTCFGTVYASDFDESINFGDNTDLISIESDGSFSDSELLSENNPGSFKELSDEIGKVESGGTLNLTRNYVYSSGDSPVVIDKKITINGNGFKIDGSKSSQILKCYGDEKFFNNVVFQDASSRNDGGAIYSESKMTFNGCVFKGITIPDDYHCGIVIYSTAEVILERCNFTNNKAVDYADSPYLVYSDYIVVKNSRFFDNIAGGIVFGRNLTVIDSDFFNNGATPIDSIPAQYRIAKNIYIKNSNFIGNSILPSAGVGFSSAVFVHSLDSLSNVSLEDCNFINNSCDGATVSISYSNGFISNCLFINNSGYGGSGLYCLHSDLKLKNLRFESNSDKYRGGAIDSFECQFIMESCDFIDNHAEEGGAIYWYGTNSSIISCNFISNTAVTGGAIANWNLVNNYIEKSSFSKNSANDGKIISFSNDFTSSSDSPYSISKISGNQYDSYDDMYGGAFSFRDNILRVTNDKLANVEVIIGGKTFKKAMGADGACSIDLSSVSMGVHEAKVICSDKSGTALCEITMPLSIESFTFYVSDVSKTYGGPERLEIDIKKSGVPVANEDVGIMINNVKYTRTTDSNGHISMAINLDAGVYDAVVTYQRFTKTSKITVNQIITKTYLNAYKTSKNSLFMNATVENSNDGDIVVFKLISPQGVITDYPAVLKSSKASINLYNLNNQYFFNATYAGDINHKSSVDAIIVVYQFSDSKIIPQMIPLDKYYKGSEKLELLFRDYDKNIIYNATADISINGVTYTRSSDTKGIISMNINLRSGTYDARVYYDGEYYGFSFTIKPTVYGEDVIADYNNVIYTANFVDSNGRALTDGMATFKINSKEYHVAISEGIASIPLSESHGSYVVEVTNPLTDETATNTVTVLPIRTKTNLEGVKNINAGGLLSVTANVNTSVGAVVFSVDSTTETVDVVDNKASFTFTIGYPGYYIIKASYMDPEGNYLSSSDSKSFNVYKVYPDINVVADDIGAGQNAIFEIALNENAEGNISVKINNNTYKNQLSGGKTIINVPDLVVGNYTYDIVYDGDKIYYPKSISGNISVFIVNVILNASDLIKYYSSPEPLSVQLLDKSGSPLTGQKIVFTLNDKDYERTTDDSGIASMNIDLNSGYYTAGVRFNGNKIYDAIKTVVQIEIMPTVSARDFTKVFRNDTQYYGTFLDAYGNPLTNTTVEFNINGVFYNRKTNENGTARLNINLNPGEYILTATNPSTSEMHSTNIIVLSSIADANNLTKFYRNESQYTVKIIDDNGNAVGAGVNVTFNINGVFYTRTTNASGIAKLNINLNPGEYIITAEYNNLKVSNTINVLPILEAKDIEMKYKDGSKFEVKLFDGKGIPFANQSIIFNINGVFYNRTTDISGIARLNINLMAGEYIITSSYSNGAAISNKITISS